MSGETAGGMKRSVAIITHLRLRRFQARRDSDKQDNSLCTEQREDCNSLRSSSCKPNLKPHQTFEILDISAVIFFTFFSINHNYFRFQNSLKLSDVEKMSGADGKAQLIVSYSHSTEIAFSFDKIWIKWAVDDPRKQD